MACTCLISGVACLQPWQPGDSEYKTKAEKLATRLLVGQAISPYATSDFASSGATWVVLSSKEGKELWSAGSLRSGSPGENTIRQFRIALAHGATATVAYTIFTPPSPWIALSILIALSAITLLLVHCTLIQPLDKLRAILQQIAPGQETLPAFRVDSQLPDQQIFELSDELAKSLSKVVEPFQSKLKQVQAELSAKEKLTKLVVWRLGPCTTPTAACETLMTYIGKDFPELAFQFAMTIAPDSNVSVIAVSNTVSSQSVQRLAEIANTLSRKLPAADIGTIDGDAVFQLGFSKLDESRHCVQLYVLRLVQSEDKSLYLCGLLRSSVSNIDRYMRQIQDYCKVQMESILRYDREYQRARTDSITGLANLYSLADYSQELERAVTMGRSDIEVTAMLVEGEILSSKNSGQQQIDQSMRELARILTQKICPRPRSADLAVGDKLIRYDTNKVLVLLEGVPRSKILRLGQELSETAQTSKLPLIRLAMARYPEQGASLEDAIRHAEVGIEYSRGENLSGCFVDSATLPTTFKTSRGVRLRPAGPDDAFNPFDLLHALQLSKQTALVNVTSIDGRKFWSYVQSGIPVRAGLGTLGGKDAMFELLATFKQGSVHIHDEQDIDPARLQELAPDEEINRVNDSVANLLVEGAKCKGLFDKARLGFTDLKLHVFPCSFSAQIWERLSRTNGEDIASMKKILLIAAAGSRNTIEILSSFEDVPSFRVWSALGLLLSNKMIRLSRLKLQSVGPEFAEPSVYCPNCHTRHQSGACTTPGMTGKVELPVNLVPKGEDGSGSSNSGMPVIDPSLPFEMQLIGRTIANKYRIDELIGEGGMAKVFKATQVGLDREVVIKIMQVLSSIESDLKRFERECKVTAQINHPNVISVFDFGTLDANRPYLVMEFVHGESLREYLDREVSMPLKEAATVMIQICSGLGEAHNKGIVHRDLKPENIMLRSQPDRPDWVKIVDFGIAHLWGGTHLTRTGMAVGTADYMSPEYLSDKPVDHRADIYALGVMMYELLTGRCAFEAESLEAMFAKHISATPRPLSYYRPDLPEGGLLDKIAEKALRKNPDDRYLTVLELRTDLEQVLGELMTSEAR